MLDNRENHVHDSLQELQKKATARRTEVDLKTLWAKNCPMMTDRFSTFKQQQTK